MTTILGAAASALSHYERVMDVTAHNLANVNTAGFKRSSSWRTWLSPTIGRVRRSNTQPHPSQLPRLLAAYSSFADLATDLVPVLSPIVDSQLGLACLSSTRDVRIGFAVANPLTLASGIFTTFTGERADGRIVASAREYV